MHVMYVMYAPLNLCIIQGHPHNMLYTFAQVLRSTRLEHLPYYKPTNLRGLLRANLAVGPYPLLGGAARPHPQSRTRPWPHSLGRELRARAQSWSTRVDRKQAPGPGATSGFRFSYLYGLYIYIIDLRSIARTPGVRVVDASAVA